MRRPTTLIVTLMFLMLRPSVTAHVSVTPRLVLVPVATDAFASVAQERLESESIRDCATVAATVWRMPPPIWVATEAEFLSSPPTPTVRTVTAIKISTSVMPRRAVAVEGVALFKFREQRADKRERSGMRRDGLVTAWDCWAFG
jgi:hypothetical protein